MSIAEKLLTIAENEQRVYDAGFEKGKAEGGGGDTDAAFEAGRQAENKAFWDSVTNNNTRTAYTMAFYKWNCEYLRPPYKITPAKAVKHNTMFSDNIKLKVIEKDYFDFSNFQPTAAAGTDAWYAMFRGCQNLETLEDIGMKAGGYYQTFYGCTNLHTIEKLRFNADTVINGAFFGVNNLINLTIEGTIGKNGFDIHWSTKISKASLLSILNACNKNVIGQGISITLPKKCIDGATDTETLLSETGDADLYGASMAARSNGYTITFA